MRKKLFRNARPKWLCGSERTYTSLSTELDEDISEDSSQNAEEDQKGVFEQLGKTPPSLV